MELKLIEEQYQRHRGALFVYAMRMLRHMEDAEDILGELYVAAMESASTCEAARRGDPGKTAAWLFGVLANLCRGTLRERHARMEKVTLVQSTEIWDSMWNDHGHDQYTSAGMLNEARFLLRHVNLSSSTRKCILSKLQGKSYAKIARENGMTVDGVRTSLRRGFAALRACPIQSDVELPRSADYLFWLMSRIPIYRPPTRRAARLHPEGTRRSSRRAAL